MHSNPSSRVALPALVLSYFLMATNLVFASTLLVDITKSFGVSVGTASQIGLVIDIVGLASGFIMGFLTLKFNHKSLFLVGIIFYAIGTLSFYFAPNFAAVIVANTFRGLGIGMTDIMIFSLIGSLFSLEKRGAIVGFSSSVGFLAFIITAPLFGFISQAAGWRLVLLWFSFPTSLICLLLGFFLIPSRPFEGIHQKKFQYMKAFKEILLNKSAVACLIGTTLIWVFTSIPVYAVSFYRIYFSVTASAGGVFSAIAAIGGICGASVGGVLINRCGRKSLTVAGAFISGLFGIMFTLVPNMVLSVAFWAISAAFAALTMVSFVSLILEQVPQYRASMMSVNGIFRAVGSILGIVIGGLVLNIYANNFQLLMAIFGSANIVLAIVVLLWTKDPCIYKEKK